MAKLKVLENTSVKLGKNTLHPDSFDDIVIKGSNSRGRWEKWPDGTLKQWGTFIATNGTTQALNGVFRSSNVQNVTFPLSFVGVPDIETLKPQIHVAFAAMVNDRNSSLFSMRLVHYVSQTVPCEVYYKAIGRWK